MKFIVYYDVRGVEHYRIVKGGRAVQAMKKRYNVFRVARY